MSVIQTKEELLALPDEKFACSMGHVITARNAVGAPQDLTGYFCPVCMGAIVGAGKMIDARILAPVQEPT
jgi:hypothetical protein